MHCTSKIVYVTIRTQFDCIIYLFCSLGIHATSATDAVSADNDTVEEEDDLENKPMLDISNEK